ncbi:MAG TPA: HWE histidine kinase domain-containing protein [Hyphomicrobiaceae bacterium]|nr:HWE histidine kinase domain-containing protein [Hyphomicrobiaceae bacterium]
MIRSLLNYVRLTTEALSRIEFVVAASAIVLALIFWTHADFVEVHRNAEAKVTTAALAMEELARSSLLIIDGALESVVSRVAELGLDQLALSSEQERLRRIAGRLPETAAVFIADRVGNVVAATQAYASPVSVSDREWFQILRDGKAEFHVGRALKGRTVHNLFFPVARSIRTRDGTFVGAAQVGVEVTYIAHLFRDLDVGLGAQMGLYAMQDGAVVARYPMTEALLGETVAALPYFAALTAAQIQSWTGWTTTRSDLQLVSVRALHGWPLLVSASLPKHEVYASAWRRLFWRTLIAAAMLIVFLLLTALAVRQARREASLMAELEHRVKNMLAVVTAVIERAREDTQSKEQFVASLRGRIHSMASAQALLSESRWRGVNLSSLTGAELAPYATTTNTTLNGPAVHLRPEATHAVAMVMHELATNAAKYGALSQPDGQVAVRWRLTAKPSADGVLEIHWEETGGPEVADPDRQGYGSGVIRDLLSYELGGKVDLRFARGGVRCSIELPAWSIVETIG